VTPPPPSPRRTTRHVALLRGINVGGKNSLPMDRLARLFERAGCRGVATYIQSGNVLFDAPEAALPTLAAGIARRIEAEHGLRVPVVLRSAAELSRAVRSNPFVADGFPPGSLHVMFLAEVPTPSGLARLDPERSRPDEFRVVGREVYLRCPGGLGRTKLTNAYFDRALGTVSTVRNWKTVQRLLEMVTS